MENEYVRGIMTDDGRAQLIPLTDEEIADIVELTDEEKWLCVATWLKGLNRFYILIDGGGKTRDDIEGVDGILPYPCQTCKRRSLCEKDKRYYPPYLRSFKILYAQLTEPIYAHHMW